MKLLFCSTEDFYNYKTEEPVKVSSIHLRNLFWDDDRLVEDNLIRMHEDSPTVIWVVPRLSLIHTVGRMLNREGKIILTGIIYQEKDVGWAVYPLGPDSHHEKKWPVELDGVYDDAYHRLALASRNQKRLKETSDAI